MSMPAGWYPNGDQWETYWDGTQWTGQHRPAAPAGMPAPPTAPAPAAAAVQPAAESFSDDGALLKFKSHINGKNADVAIYPDRVEWLMARGVSGAKVTAGVLTGGLSMLAIGVKNGKAGSEMIPMKSITGVSTKRDGMINRSAQ